MNIAEDQQEKILDEDFMEVFSHVKRKLYQLQAMSDELSKEITKLFSMPFPADLCLSEYKAQQLFLQTPLRKYSRDLSIRTLRCFDQENIITVRDLVRCPRCRVLRLRNFGRKSMFEVDDFLASNNLYFDMDISKYEI